MDHLEDTLHRRFMTEALRLAARISRRPWPNPPVGALVVRNGRVVGRGAHQGAGTDHAEAVALRDAGVEARGATLYCTLEPCNHQGRRPPCAPLVAASGIAAAVIAIADPNPNVCGGGARLLREAGIETRVGVMGEEALDLVWPFAATRAFERPFVCLKTAASLDGFFAPRACATPPGQPFYLTGIDARRDVHRLRRWCDAVVVGERTMAADRPRLDGRLVEPEDPCPAADPVPGYVDTDLSLDAGWTRPHWIFAGREAASGPRRACVERAQGEVIPCAARDGRVDPASLVAEFGARGGHVLLVEGGPTLAASFLRCGLVDRWISYTAPLVLGSGVRSPDGPAGTPFHATRVERLGSDIKATFDTLPFHERLAGLCSARGES